MQVVPSAVGQSDGVIVFWDDNPEIGVAWPRPVQVVDALEWGIGSVNQEECLVLYLFANGQFLEVYLLPELPTSPTQVLDVIKLVRDWDPSLLKVRYGQSPGDKTHEILFLLPKTEREDAVAKLRELHQRASEGKLQGTGNGTGIETTVRVSEAAFAGAGSALLLRLNMYLADSAGDVEE